MHQWRTWTTRVHEQSWTGERRWMVMSSWWRVLQLRSAPQKPEAPAAWTAVFRMWRWETKWIPLSSAWMVGQPSLISASLEDSRPLDPTTVGEDSATARPPPRLLQMFVIPGVLILRMPTVSLITPPSKEDGWLVDGELSRLVRS